MQENMSKEIEEVLKICPECSKPKYFFADLVQCDRNKNHVVCKKCFDKTTDKNKKKCLRCDGKMTQMSIDNLDYTKINQGLKRGSSYDFTDSLKFQRDIQDVNTYYWMNKLTKK